MRVFLSRIFFLNIFGSLESQLSATITIFLSSMIELFFNFAIKDLKKVANFIWLNVLVVPFNPSTREGLNVTIKLALKPEDFINNLPGLPFLAQPYLLVVSLFPRNSSRNTTWNCSFIKFDINFIQNKRLV